MVICVAKLSGLTMHPDIQIPTHASLTSKAFFFVSIIIRANAFSPQQREQLCFRSGFALLATG